MCSPAWKELGPKFTLCRVFQASIEKSPLEVLYWTEMGERQFFFFWIRCYSGSRRTYLCGMSGVVQSRQDGYADKIRGT
jgi:hypothetical protein